MSINFSPGPKILSILDMEEWILLPSWAGEATVVSGSASVIQTMKATQVDSGATASSSALIKLAPGLGWSSGKARNVLNWSKKILMHLSGTNVAGTTNGIGRVSLGKDNAEGFAALTDKGIGISVLDSALKGIVHNGTSEVTTDLGTTLSDGVVFRVTITSDGAGNVEWFVDKVSKGSSTGGPTGDSTAGNDLLQIEAGNGADSAAQTLALSMMKIYVEQ